MVETTVYKGNSYYLLRPIIIDSVPQQNIDYNYSIKTLTENAGFI